MSFLLRSRLSLMMFFQYFVWGILLPMLYQHVGPNSLDIPKSLQGYLFATYGLGSVLGPFLIAQIADRYLATERVMGLAHILGGILLLVAARFTTFWPLFICLLCYYNLYMPTMGLSNSLTFRSIGESNQSAFPGIRLWGTIGWIVGGLFFGFYLESDTLEFLKPFYEVLGAEASFPKLLASWKAFSGPILTPIYDAVGSPSYRDCLRIPGVVSLFYGLYCFTLPHTPPSPARASDPIDKKSAFLESLELMRNRSFTVLVVVSGLLGIMLAFYFACENAFLESVGANPKHTGAIMTIGQIAEIAIMLLVPLSVAKLGIKRTMIIGAGAWALRFGLSAYGRPYGLMIASIALHGFCFGFYFVVAQMYVDRSASADIKASAQSLLVFLIYGMGSIVGSVLAGYVRDYFNDDWRYVWGGPFVLTIICILIFAALFRDTEEIKRPIDALDAAAV